MIFDTNADGSTKRIFVQLSNYHGVAVVDFATHEEITRFELPAIAGREQGDSKDSRERRRTASRSPPTEDAARHQQVVRPALRLLAARPEADWQRACRQSSEWLTLTPDGKTAYVAVAGDDETAAVDIKTLKVTARVKVGYVPKRNGTGVLQTQ